MSLKITACTKLYPPSHIAGSEMNMHNLLLELVARGHDVHAYTTAYMAPHKIYDWDGITVHPLSPRDEPKWRESDVILAHLDAIEYAGYWAHASGKPFVATVDNSHQPLKTAIIDAQPELVVYNSEWIREGWQLDLPGIVVPPPVWPERVKTEPGDRITLINMNENKGGDLFWELAAALPDMKFLGVKGAYGAQVEGDLPNVEVIAHTPDIKSVYAKTRTLIMPSWYESWGMTANEAMISGIPVVSTITPGLRECVGDAGIFADRKDISTWIEALTALSDGRKWRAASRRALQRAEELDPTEGLNLFADSIESLA